MSNSMRWGAQRNRKKATLNNLRSGGVPSTVTPESRKYMTIQNTDYRKRQKKCFNTMDRLNQQRDDEITEREAARLKATLAEFEWKD